MDDSIEKEESVKQAVEHHHHNVQVNQSNSMGTAGFVLALIAIFISWVPVLGWIIWLLGLIFSAIGLSREPKGLAIAGLVISLIGIIILVAFLGALAALIPLAAI